MSTPTVDLILKRRSVREGFSSRPIPPEELSAILDCGMAAPSSKDAKPWRFHVVTDRSVLHRIAELVSGADGAETFVPSDPLTGRARPEWSSTVQESAAVLRVVPTGVFVENQNPFSRGRRVLADVAPGVLDDLLIGYTLEILGIGAAIQNMWIAVESYGASAAFLGDILVAEEQIRAVLGIDGDLVGVLAIGLIDES